MKSVNNLTLLLILVVAAGLRLFQFSQIPFTHDEFSALFRLGFDSLGELIEKGVKVDFHPAGVQVFLYYYTQWFGTEEWVVKLPFALMGIGSVWFVYRLGKMWFHETTGLLAASLLATIQYTVMYSQIARPYGSGLFLSLVMVFFWSRLMISPQKGFLKNTILYVVSASLCSYNHHFSLLFVTMVGVTGIFMIPKVFRLKYLLAGVLVFVLYIPHLPVFFHQLSKGGVEGWLAKPDSGFLLDYLYYCLNYSWPLALAVALLIVYGYLANPQKNWRWIRLSLLWFAIPLTIGFFYSVYVNAVLQFSVLIFSFPLLVLFVFGALPRLSQRMTFVLSFSIMILGAYSLIETRRHYTVFYESVYENILLDLEKAKASHPHGIYLIDSHPEITEYYQRKDHLEDPYISFNEEFQSLKDFKKYLQDHHGEHETLYFGCLSNSNSKIIPLILEFYPFIERQGNYFGGTTYLFTQKVAPRTTALAKWVVPLTSLEAQKAQSVHFDGNLEWGPSFTLDLKSFVNSRNNFIDLSVEIESANNLKDVVLVGEITEGDEKVYWGGSDGNDFVLETSQDTLVTTVYQTLKLSDIKVDREEAVLTVYVWNKGHKEFTVKEVSVSRRQGNPIIYSWYYPFELRKK